MLINGFLAYIQNEKRYSAHTILAYQSDLLQYEQFLLNDFNLTLVEVKNVHLRSFVASLMEKQVSASAIGRKISTLRSFYKFLLRKEIIDSNPVAAIKAPKIQKKLPVFVETNKMNFLLDSTELFDDSFKDQRDHMVLELLFGTGMRLTELIGLKIQDVDFFSQTLKILGKRNKERLVPFSNTLARVLKSYLELKTLQNFDNITDHLIVNNKGQVAYPKFVYRIVTRYLDKISTQDKKSPHVLRHSYATSLLEAGADLNAIKELLGHASLAATQVYVHNSVERLKSIYKQAHPKA